VVLEDKCLAAVRVVDGSTRPLGSSLGPDFLAWMPAGDVIAVEGAESQSLGAKPTPTSTWCEWIRRPGRGCTRTNQPVKSRPGTLTEK
jgi:hypothetical protein